jgi:hypothetical protein
MLLDVIKNPVITVLSSTQGRQFKWRRILGKHLEVTALHQNPRIRWCIYPPQWLRDPVPFQAIIASRVSTQSLLFSFHLGHKA